LTEKYFAATPCSCTGAILDLLNNYDITSVNCIRACDWIRLKSKDFEGNPASGSTTDFISRAYAK